MPSSSFQVPPPRPPHTPPTSSPESQLGLFLVILATETILQVLNLSSSCTW